MGKRKGRKLTGAPGGTRPRRDCPHCQGTGYRPGPAVEHPNGRTYGNVSAPCPCKTVGLPARVPAVDQKSQAAGERPPAREMEI